MPTRRRPIARSPRAALPPAVAALFTGQPVPFSPENRRALADAIYLGPARGAARLPEDAELRAIALLGRWRAEGR